MKKENLFDIIGDVDEQKVATAGRAMTAKKKAHTVWMKWGAMAACLCLVVVGAFVFHNKNIDPIPGTVGEEIKNIAVFPATETIENVETATIKSISETDAYSMDILGEYLPSQLPEGYTFNKASIIETIMKNGTKYHMLRAIYSKIDSLSTQTENNDFVVFVMDYKPNTEKNLYSVVDINETMLAEIHGQVFHISYGDIYVGISEMNLPTSDILTVINSISPNSMSAEIAENQVAGIGRETPKLAVEISEEDANALSQIISNGNWMEETTDCESDCAINLGGHLMYYHSGSGTLNKYNLADMSIYSSKEPNVSGKSLVLSEEDRTTVNAILERYISLGIDSN